jgi:hypothetical protein
MEQVGGSTPRSQICDGSAEIKEIRIPGGHKRRKGEVFLGFGIEEGEEEEVEVGEKKLLAMEALVSSKFF